MNLYKFGNLGVFVAVVVVLLLLLLLFFAALTPGSLVFSVVL